jgi:hypothetical protein
MMHFIYKWPQKCRFLAQEPAERRDLAEVTKRRPGKTALFLSFPYVRPEPVLVK